MYEFAQLLENVRDSRFGFDFDDPECAGAFSNADLLKQKYAQIQEHIDQGLVPGVIESPLACQLELTYQCNSRCIHCYNDSGSDRRKGVEELTQEQWLDVARQLGEMGVFRVAISGGEPLLLRDRLYEIMDVFRDYGVVMLMVTNGSRVTPSFVKRLVDGGYRISRIQVSIDADTPEVHDYLRGHRGSWARATNAVRLLVDAGFPVVVAHTVFRNNFSRFQNMVDLGLSLGARAIITAPCMLSGRAATSEVCRDLLLDADERERFVEEVTVAKKRMAHARRGRPFRVRAGASVAISLRVRAIEPGRTLLIRPDGTVKVDCVLPFSIGNVRESDLLTIWRETGQSIWRHPEVLDYISNIENEEHMVEKNLPRPHVDASIRVR